MRLRRQYAKEDFIAEHSADPTSRHLANALASEVQEVLHEVILQRVGQIVEQLNSRGHNLRHYEEPIPGVISLRDDAGEGRDYTCDLRLAVDTVVSVGFRDTIDPDGASEPLNAPDEPSLK